MFFSSEHEHFISTQLGSIKHNAPQKSFATLSTSFILWLSSRFPLNARAALNSSWRQWSKGKNCEKYIFRYKEHNTTGYKGMLYLTRTPDLVVKVNSREGMEVEKLVKETAVNVIQKVYEFKSTKKPQHEVSIISCYHCQNWEGLA